MATAYDTAPTAKALTYTQPQALTKLLRLALLYLLTIFLALLFTLPLIWAISTSLKPVPQVYKLPPEWIPRPFVWQNYPDALTYIPFLRYVSNTLVIAVTSMVGIIFSNAIVAYGFARLRWRYRELFFFVCLATMMIPYQVVMVPLFIMYSKWGWVNSYLPLIVPHFFGNAFYIFLLRQFFLSIPQEISDAARVDGCTEWGILRRIIAPLSRPALATVAVLHFMWSWNDYMGPLLYIKDETLYTVSIGLTRYQAGGYTQPRWAFLMAASVTTLIPILILFFLAQRTFIEGITLTGIKG